MDGGLIAVLLSAGPVGGGESVLPADRLTNRYPSTGNISGVARLTTYTIRFFVLNGELSGRKYPFVAVVDAIVLGQMQKQRGV